MKLFTSECALNWFSNSFPIIIQNLFAFTERIKERLNAHYENLHWWKGQEIKLYLLSTGCSGLILFEQITACDSWTQKTHYKTLTSLVTNRKYTHFKRMTLDLIVFRFRVPHVHSNITAQVSGKSVAFTVCNNYSCFAKAYMISKHPHILYPVSKQHSGGLFIFFSLILCFLLGSF